MEGSTPEDRLKWFRSKPMKRAINSSMNVITADGFLPLVDMFERPPGSEGTMDPSRWTEISSTPEKLIKALAPFHRLWHERDVWFSGPEGRNLFAEFVMNLVRNRRGTLLSLFTPDEWERWGGVRLLSKWAGIRHYYEDQPIRRPVVGGLLHQMGDKGRKTAHLWRLTAWDILESAISDPAASEMLRNPENPKEISKDLKYRIGMSSFNSENLLRCRGIIIPPSRKCAQPISVFGEMARKLEVYARFAYMQLSYSTRDIINTLVSDRFSPEVLMVPVSHRGGEPFLTLFLQASVEFNRFCRKASNRIYISEWEGALDASDKMILGSFHTCPEAVGVFHRFMENPDYGEEMERLFPRCSLMIRTSLAAESCAEPFPEM